MTALLQIMAASARTPVGLRADSSAAAVRAGISRVKEHPVLIDGSGEPLRCAWCPSVEPAILGPTRQVELAADVLTDLLEQLPAPQRGGARVSVLLTLPAPRPGFGPGEAAHLVSELGRRGGAERVAVEQIASGHAGLFRVLEVAAQRISHHPDAICIVGGVDSYLDAEALAPLDAAGRTVRAGVRSGFFPGEAAGMLAVCGQRTPSHWSSRPLAVVRAVATGQEARPVDCDEGLLGEELTATIGRALKVLRLPQEKIDEVYCDLNGERHRTYDWSFALLRLSAAFRDGTDYRIGASSWGDLGAASGVLSCILAIEAWRRGYARGPRALVFGSSFEGLRGAALLEKAEGVPAATSAPGSGRTGLGGVVLPFRSR